MTAYRLEVTPEQTPATCGQIGPAPQLPASTDWPRCQMCDEELVAFLELVLPECDGSPFQPGSRLQVFACRQHDDIAGTIYSDSTFFDVSQTRNLPAEYWNITDGHYLLRLLPPSAETVPSRPEPRLVPQFLAATPTDDDDEDGFKLFGQPYWLQDAEQHACACGAAMQLLLQVPEGQTFPMSEGADEQPNSFSATDYCLFLGNQLYVLACSKQCQPLALWPVLQS